jgi:cardiolipin synthase
MRKTSLVKRVTIFVAYLLTWGTIPHVLFHKRRPAAALAWVWSIIALPFVGPLAYWGFGADHMQRRRVRKARRLGVMRHPAGDKSPPGGEELSPRKSDLVRTLSEVNQMPPSTARHVELLLDAEAFYPALLERIEQARHHVHFESFIWRDDEVGRTFLAALVRAARRGVKVRLLLDQIGCIALRKAVFRPLLRAGGKMSWFYSLPLWRHTRFMNLRNHRKLQIIDGETAFVGGMNIGEEYRGARAFGSWRDAQMRVEGSVVTHLQRLFAEDWFFATDERLTGPGYFPKATGAEPYVVQIISGGPDLPREPVPKSMLALLAAARHRLWISTGYFAPDQLLLTGLQLCAARNVDVRVIVSKKSDHAYMVHVGRAYYEEMLEWGVRVYEYTEGINHKKAMLIDDDWLMIGSANSDNRSMRLNFELNLLAHAPEQAARLRATLEHEFSISNEIELKRFRRRPFFQKLREAALRPLGPLL